MSLHKFTAPYPGMGAKVVKGGLLIYPVPIILNAKKDYRGNRLVEGRHVVSVVDDLWAASAPTSKRPKATPSRAQ